jgi:hypothetical protein
MNYVEYGDILEQFSEKALQSRFARLLEECRVFLADSELSENLRVEESILSHVVLDYYADISRLKEFHKIEKVNDIKITAYLYYWFVRRKPLQVILSSSVETTDSKIEKLSYANELFVYSQLVHFLQKDLSEDIVAGSRFSAFLNSLYYFLKYRLYDAQTLEMLLISFFAGKECVGDGVSSACENAPYVSI